MSKYTELQDRVSNTLKELHRIEKEVKELAEKESELQFKVGDWVIVDKDGCNASGFNDKNIPYNGIYHIYGWRTTPFKIASPLKPTDFDWKSKTQGAYLLTDSESKPVGNVYNDALRPATPTEIKEHLISIAKRKGFDLGVSYRDVDGDISQGGEEFCYSRFGLDSLDMGIMRGYIYKDGRWATIINKKKDLPKTKAGIAELIQTYCDQNDGLPFPDDIYNDFLKDYNES